jgi:hypothetical protein
MAGTVNISRGIWDDTAFKAQPFTEREAFMWLIMEASYKPREKRIGNIEVKLERGQLAASIRFMAEAWDWEKSTVDRFLKRLEKRDMIGTESGTGVTVITICKYNEYQSEISCDGTDKNENWDSSGTAAGQQRDKPKKGLINTISSFHSDIERVNAPVPIKAEKKKSNLKTRLPDNFVPNETGREKAKEAGMDKSAFLAELNQFRDYHASNGSLKLDWEATWRTWCGNYQKYRPKKANQIHVEGQPYQHRGVIALTLDNIRKGRENGRENSFNPFLDDQRLPSIAVSGLAGPGDDIRDGD